MRFLTNKDRRRKKWIWLVSLAALRPFVAMGDSCDTTTFSRPQYFTTNGAYDVVTGDFNRDGKQDFVINNASNVIVFLGDGRGGFLAPKTYSIGGFHQSITARDLNGDGYLDVVLPNYPQSSVSVLLNDGAGGFGPAMTFAAGDLPRAIGIGDFNHDRKPDLAVINGESNDVSVLLGDGAGGFGAPTNFPVGAGPNAITVRDFNGDGNPDLAVSTSEELDILLGDGAGNFTPGTSYPLGGNSFAVAGADFNHDGHPDIAVGVSNIYPNNHVAIFLGDGKGSFTMAPDIPVSDPADLAIADFNSDGEPDIAVANYFGATVAVAFGDGTGKFIPVTEYRIKQHDLPLGIAEADFNRDGKPDLVIANYGNQDASVTLNVPKVTVIASDPSASEPGSDVGRFRLHRNGCTADPLTVYYTVSGSAEPGDDYEALPGQLTIPAGKANAAIEVTPLDDNNPEPPETVTVSLTSNPFYFIGGGKANATVTITDND